MKQILIVFIVLALLIGSVSAAIDAKQEKQSAPYTAEYRGDMLLQNWIAHYLDYITNDQNKIFDNYIWTQEVAKPDSITFDVPEYEEYTYVSEPYVGVKMPEKVVVYVLNNYNGNMTGKTITADMNWTDTNYITRSVACNPEDAYVRLEFQSAMGDYDANEYWWSTGDNSLNIDNGAGGILSISLDECDKWSNIGVINACDDRGGFANAVENVKQVGVAFGSSCRYASGVAVDGGTGTFTINSFKIEAPVVEGTVVAGTPIQNAVDAAVSGDTIIVGTGTYEEAIVINGKDINLIADGEVLIKPTGPCTLHKDVIQVYNSIVTIEGFKIDANYATSKCLGGIYARGMAELNEGPAHLNAINNNVYNYGKNGITVNGELATAVIEGNTVTGRGPLPLGDYAQNGIQFGWYAKGIVRDNVVTGNYYIPDTWSASGILLYGVYPEEVTRGNNVLAGNKIPQSIVNARTPWMVGY